MKNIGVRTLVNCTTFFALFILLMDILTSDSLSRVLAQGSGDWAIDHAQRAIRERITSREGGHDPSVLFNSDVQTEFKSNTEVRVRGTGAFSHDNNLRNNNNPRYNGGRSRNFFYEAVVSNRNSNVSGIRYGWRGGWSGSSDGGNYGAGAGGYGGDNQPDGRVSYSGPIINRHSGKSLDVSVQGIQDGANMQQWEYDDQSNQIWGVVDLGNGEAAIISRRSGKALTIQGGRDNNRANIVQRSWNDSPQQRWRLEQIGGGYHRIVSVDNGKCLGVTKQGKQNGVNVQLWDYANQTNQQWRLRR